ncbi:MAG: FAD:protein FMN transferase [Longimicrobiales bacterium]
MDSATRIAQRMAALEAMGFRRTDAVAFPAEAEPVPGGRQKVAQRRPSMGTLVSITAIHSSRGLVEEAAGRAFEEMDRVVELLNRYDPSSAISVLNDSGDIGGPPPELSGVLTQALAYNRRSLGVFDPTVLPLVDLFRFRAEASSDGAAPSLPPSPAEVRELLELVDAGAVEIGPRSIRLRKAGMGLTLDGIAKGFVVDRMAEVLSGCGLSDYLIDAGGDIRSSGVREDGRPWQVAVQDPGKRNRFPDVFPLSGMAVATSGSYEIYFDPGRSHHHIVDSRSGVSPNSSQSVSVVAPTAMEADALATSVFLMEPMRGAAFIDSIPRSACLIVDQHGRQVKSARWRSAGEPPTPKAGTL